MISFVDFSMDEFCSAQRVYCPTPKIDMKNTFKDNLYVHASSQERPTACLDPTEVKFWKVTTKKDPFLGGSEGGLLYFLMFD